VSTRQCFLDPAGTAVADINQCGLRRKGVLQTPMRQRMNHISRMSMVSDQALGMQMVMPGSGPRTPAVLPVLVHDVTRPGTSCTAAPATRASRPQTVRPVTIGGSCRMVQE